MKVQNKDEEQKGNLMIIIENMDLEEEKLQDIDLISEELKEIDSSPLPIASAQI